MTQNSGQIIILANTDEKLTRNAQKINMVEDKLLTDPNSIRHNSWMNRLLKQRGKLNAF